MAPFRPRPHVPVPGSVRPHDARRLHRLRARLRRRWQRKRKRQLAFLALAIAALAGAVAVGLGAFSSASLGRMLGALELAAVILVLLTVLSFAVYALWRADRIWRRARSARIRLVHVERRLEALRTTDDA